MPDKTLTHEEFERRVREAMKPPAPQGAGRLLGPGVQQMRQGVQLRRPLAPVHRAIVKK